MTTGEAVGRLTTWMTVAQPTLSSQEKYHECVVGGAPYVAA
jgi:hypothetical protein